MTPKSPSSLPHDPDAIYGLTTQVQDLRLDLAKRSADVQYLEEELAQVMAFACTSSSQSQR